MNCPIAIYDSQRLFGTVVIEPGGSGFPSIWRPRPSHFQVATDLGFACVIMLACQNVQTEGSFPGCWCRLIMLFRFLNSADMFTPNACHAHEVTWKISSRTSPNSCAKILKPAGRRRKRDGTTTEMVSVVTHHEGNGVGYAYGCNHLNAPINKNNNANNSK